MSDFKFLQSKRKSYYSQNGEDGVLDYLFTKIPCNKWAVEFGAWDAKYLSNTYYFIEKLQYCSVLIEGDAEKMDDLKKNTSAFGDRVFAINAFVEDKGENTLDAILQRTPIPKDFDILSIDIDGNDYFVWQAFEQYQPKVVIIEINIKDKPEVNRIHDKTKTSYVWGESGSSMTALTELAHKKGYALLTNVACNVIFVDKKYLHLFYEEEPLVNEVYTYESFALIDLTLSEAKRKGMSFFIKKAIRLPWHFLKSLRTKN